MAKQSAGLIGRNDIRRIGATVRDFERRPRSNIGPSTGFCDPPGQVGQWILITGACLRFGCYIGQKWNYSASAFNSATASTWDSSDVGSASGAVLTIINEAERAQSTHSLTETGTVIKRVLCTPAGFKDSAGRQVWITNSFTSSDSCTPL